MKILLLEAKILLSSTLALVRWRQWKQGIQEQEAVGGSQVVLQALLVHTCKTTMLWKWYLFMIHPPRNGRMGIYQTNLKMIERTNLKAGSLPGNWLSSSLSSPSPSFPGSAPAQNCLRFCQNLVLSRYYQVSELWMAGEQSETKINRWPKKGRYLRW